MAKIGKNAIENLTIGMYKESQIIFREYIQNSADQIDLATEKGMFDEKLFIDIKIDKKNRYISIRDNATGIPKDKVVESLENVADSEKIRGESKGFRGIGRLGGLAYCEELVFTTTYKGENQKTIMTWNAKMLIDKLNDLSVKDDASKILEDVISYKYEDCDVDEHYFLVEMKNVKIQDNNLLDVEEVRKYIAINAPVPFSSKMIYKEKIKEYLNKTNQKLSEYTIYVNSEMITKPYVTTLYVKDGNGKRKEYDKIFDIKIKEFKLDNGELLAWMWYGISNFKKRIPSSVNEVVGLRLRQSNIQIGNEETLAPFFKEERGNFYFIGEVHAVHKNLIPNARRDYFNENEERSCLDAELKKFFNEELYKLYYYANNVKSALKKEAQLYETKQKYERKVGRFVDSQEKESLENDIKLAEEKNKKAQKDLNKYEEKAKENETFKLVLEHIKKEFENRNDEENIDYKNSSKKEMKQTKNRKKKNNYLVDELSKLKSSERKLVSKIYSIILKNLPEQEGNALIKKIQEELKK